VNENALRHQRQHRD
jgi:hypothetical protein